jgi:hypothetical protein
MIVLEDFFRFIVLVSFDRTMIGATPRQIATRALIQELAIEEQTTHR